MAHVLHTLFVEDSADDVMLLLRQLRRDGFEPVWCRVETSAELEAALDEATWDVILADYTLPRFSALAALAIVQKRQIDIPFIIVSGSIGEETAVAALKAGAHDYVMKDNASRLSAAIERGLREMAARCEHQRMEAALRESEERWNFALEGVGDGVWDWDLQHGKIFFSRRWKEILGYAENEISYDPHEWAIRVHPDDFAAASAAMEQHMRGETAVYLAEYRLRRKDGTYIWIMARGKVMSRADDGSPLRFVGTNTDVTARKQAESERLRLEQQLRQSQKMEALGTLAGGIAHDFNNVLTAIMGYASLLEDDLYAHADALDMLAEITKAGNRARELVRQIFTFSRKQEQPLQAIALQPVINEALKLLRAAIPSTISINAAIDPMARPVMADAIQIHQVMMNLATNAAMAMEDQVGRLEVSYSSLYVDAVLAATHPDLQPGPYVRLSVADTGHGMDAATIERIFEPFFTTRTFGKGTGLGLAVVHGIVKNHRGAITVTSQPGFGSLFHVYFPALTSNITAHSAPTPDTRRGNGEHILCLDDEALLIRPITIILERQGYRVTCYNHPLPALADFIAHPDLFDLVLTDLTMPGLSGLDVAQRLLQLRPTLPIILMTGFSGSVNLEDLRALGLRQLLFKPFSVTALYQAVQEALDEQHQIKSASPNFDSSL